MTPAPTGDIRVKESAGVVTVTFDRDRKLNALNGPMFDVIRRTVESVSDRPSVRVLVFRAAGRYFCAGVDVVDRDPPPGQAEDAPGSVIRRYHRARHRLFDELEALEIPVVIAAQGPCLGLGLEMAVSCDFRLASDAATFWLPELPRLGVLPGSGGTSRLTRLVGPHWARWMVMAGRPVEASLARMIGLVHEIYPAAEFEDGVDRFVAELSELPAEAVGLAKLAIDGAVNADRTSARDLDRIANTGLLASADHRALVGEFRQKSVPD